MRCFEANNQPHGKQSRAGVSFAAFRDKELRRAKDTLRAPPREMIVCFGFRAEFALCREAVKP